VASRYVVEPVAQRTMGALTGNPVDLTTGRQLIPDEIDFSLPGLMPVEWSRFCASGLTVDSVLGLVRSSTNTARGIAAIPAPS